MCGIYIHTHYNNDMSHMRARAGIYGVNNYLMCTVMSYMGSYGVNQIMLQLYYYYSYVTHTRAGAMGLTAYSHIWEQLLSIVMSHK